MKWPAVFPHISFCTTIVANHCNWNLWLQIDPHCCGESFPNRSPKTAPLQDFREVGLPVVMHETTLKSNLAAWSWCTWICHMFFFFLWNKLFPLSKGSSTFSMIFWYILCILPTRLIFNMTRWHECTGCQQWIIITGQEFISYPACKNSMISFSSFISPEKLLSHCLPPLRRW